ncbi:ligase-associated DNA damage response DEXH box helicase [Pararcticibacter amylolyticus]|uniref:Ligase-associated DNA damage response DEXH box helicase n=1 Tax=Pararcticibacter amylolyticus TaxID=2173175 RepID=A0A2U2PMQ4_9SPHI|nr:ligase-associated DNA damage response DEXH box helicase [Pararcticibacter amylolyticus]PWG82608.1 ligase-associated DNA damage response DEXH box helicase [Pararcticibacter amylolyticus]
MELTAGERVIHEWFEKKGWQQFPFQKEMQRAYLQGYSGLLNAPTGSGKTFALFLPFLADYINTYPTDYTERKGNGLLMLWITPLRALTNDIRRAMQTAVDDIGLPWTIGTRTGDTSAKEKEALKRKQPEVLLTTPESLHLMLAQKEYPKLFEGLKVVVADEWHELLGTKRGVQLELGLSRLKAITGKGLADVRRSDVTPDVAGGSAADISAGSNSSSSLRIWGISATIGNLTQAADVLLGNTFPPERVRLIRARLDKKIVIESVIPENIEQFSWSGHLGIKLLPQVMEIVAASKTTLIFTNTRSQSEIWYQAILDKYPEYAGVMAMHHGSLDNELRNWVEEALHQAMLKLVVCTSSLDLGVDFRPVDTVIQIGSPKGVARFMQRAGRSGHHPGAVSRAWFVPTHSLELLEGAAIKQALKEEIFESRDPFVLAMDVLTQYLVTLAVSDGFRPQEIFRELKTTYAYADLEERDYGQILDFITKGGKTLSRYDEYLKVEVEEGLYKVKSRRVAMRHRLTMGTIVSDVSMRIKFLSGGYLGTIEEDFISRLKPGDNFWFAGRSLELIKVKEMTAFVKKSARASGKIPSWMGGRIPLSSQLSAMFRKKLDEVAQHIEVDIEVKTLRPLFDLQAQLSHLPRSGEFLIEKFDSGDGHHLFFYPFEGRLVHEGMASLFAWRLAQIKDASYSIAMNDYGFELLTDEDIPLEQAIDASLFTEDHLLDDIQNSLNANEMARRRFRDIAHIAGLIFTGFPGKTMKNRHLQASTSLIFDVFREYEPDNVLIRQAYNEALQFQLEEFRLREALRRLNQLKVVIRKTERPTPFAFPIMVDRLREKLTTESLEARVAKMKLFYS